MSQQGIESFTPTEGTTLFAELLARPRTELGLFRLSLRQWIEAHPHASGARFLAELEGEEPARQTRTDTFRESLLRAGAADRRALVEAHVIDQVSRVLRIDRARVEPKAPFSSLGMDSLMSLELRNRLESSLGLRLSAALLFTHATPAALTQHLVTSIAPPPLEPTPASASAPSTPSPSPPAPPAPAVSSSPPPAGEPPAEDDADALAQLAEFEEFLR